MSSRVPQERGPGPGPGALVGAVGQNRDVLSFEDPDDPVGVYCGQVVAAARQGRGDLQRVAGRVGHDLHVHAVPAVLEGVVGPAVAHTRSHSASVPSGST